MTWAWPVVAGADYAHNALSTSEYLHVETELDALASECPRDLYSCVGGPYILGSHDLYLSVRWVSFTRKSEETGPGMYLAEITVYEDQKVVLMMLASRPERDEPILV
jgi:hypothetical protein